MQTFVEAQRKRASPLEPLRLVICQWSFVVTSRAHLSVGVLLFGLMKLPKDFSKPVSLAPTLPTGVGKDAQTRKYDARCLRAVQSAQEEVRRLETSMRCMPDEVEVMHAAYTATASALPEEVRSGDGIPEILENTEVWKHSPDIAGTSDDGDPTAQDENLTPLDESRFDVTALSPSKCPLSSPSDTNMYSSSCILHPSSAKSDGTEPSVCQWVPRAGKGFEAHISVSHKIFLWPAVYRQFALGGATTAPDLRPLAWIGSAWLMRKDELGTGNLPCDENIPFSRLASGCVLFPNLSNQQVEDYSAAYFDTFNRLFPLLDRDSFVNTVLSRRSRQGYKDDDPNSVLALLVCALGQLPLEGAQETSASTIHGQPSGFRGGTPKRPPGLSLFNQARRRLGIIATRCSLETVHIFLLQGTYFEACARHTDFWSSVSAASMSCMFLVKSQAIHWSSRHGDLIKRAFWICVLHERSINLEFCVAETGIEKLAELVPLPHFPGILDKERASGNPGTEGIGELKRPTESDYAYHLSAVIDLGRSIRRANDIIHDFEPVIHSLTPGVEESPAFAHAFPGQRLSDPTDQGQLPHGLVHELAHELECWRLTLPSRLQWSDDRKFDFTEIDPTSDLSRTNFFNLATHLRTCYYQARFLVYRPFIYKALHQPALMTPSDRYHCAFAVEAACHWPMSLAPPKNKLHLLPHLFSWTQNFLAILLILKFCMNQGPLSNICQENGLSENYIWDTFVSMKTWLEDSFVATSLFGRISSTTSTHLIMPLNVSFVMHFSRSAPRRPRTEILRSILGRLRDSLRQRWSKESISTSAVDDTQRELADDDSSWLGPPPGYEEEGGAFFEEETALTSATVTGPVDSPAIAPQGMS
ncbi:hypothetical protein Q7P37_004909 [Cladosporium fusiforme]